MSRGGLGQDVEVAVIGGGPVGLALACLLAGAGVRTAVLERRRAPSRHSRSIGIHPPALEALGPTGAVPELLVRGVRVRRGHAYAGGRRIGTLTFDRCPGPYRFVLTLPQAESERVLEERLRAVDGGALRRGVEVVALSAGTRDVRLSLAGGEVLRAAVAVACDGHASRVRRLLKVPVRARAHAGSYLMGDFPDETGLAADAAIYLTPVGVVESFPLPGGWRRWVAAAPPGAAPPSGPLDGVDGAALPEERAAAAARLSTWAWRRAGERLDADRCAMVSAFGTRTALAASLAAGRVVLAGDAAHVMPPFGGQGMNLGWLDAAALAAALLVARGQEHLARTPAWTLQRALAGYQRARLRAAAAAARRAEFNLLVGRASEWDALRAGAVWAGLRSPLAAAFARRFTMRGLADGVPAFATGSGP